MKELNLIVQQDPHNFAVLTQLAILSFFDYEDVKAANLLRMALSVKNNYIPALFRSTGCPEKAKALYN